VLIVSDSDMFRMLDEQGSGRLGWDVASEALGRCGGGGTFVLQLPEWLLAKGWFKPTHLDRLGREGWNVAQIDSMEQLVAFACQFSRTNFDRKHTQV
jgi:hypothetical protein